MSKTGVPYADEALHAVRGCTKISRGCKHCYACQLAATRLKSNQKYKGLAKMRNGEPCWTGEVRAFPEELRQPLQRRKPTTWFVADMGDLFHEAVPFEFIAAVFGVMAATPRHTYLLLTKRPERMADWFRWVERQPTGLFNRKTWPNFICAMAAQEVDPDFMVPGGVPRFGAIPEQPWPLPNVWAGTSCEGQAEFYARVPYLLNVPTHKDAGKWLSLEPQIGPIDATYLHELPELPVQDVDGHALGPDEYRQEWHIRSIVQGCEKVAGGRCGRPFELDWAISMHEQVQKANAENAQFSGRPKTSYYLKQTPGPGGKVDELPQLYGRTWRELPWPKR